MAENLRAPILAYHNKRLTFEELKAAIVAFPFAPVSWLVNAPSDPIKCMDWDDQHIGLWEPNTILELQHVMGMGYLTWQEHSALLMALDAAAEARAAKT